MKIAVLTDPDTATGFRMAGLEVAVAHTAEEAVQVLTGLIEQDAYALVAVDEALLPDPHKAVARVMRGRDLPVLLPFPSLRFAFGEAEGDEVEAYMRRLVRETIGYEIKL